MGNYNKGKVLREHKPPPKENIFVKIALTFDLGVRSKVISPNESPYMISYMCIIYKCSLYLSLFLDISENGISDL